MLTASWMWRRLPLIVSWPKVASELGLEGARYRHFRRTPLGAEIELRLSAPTTVRDIEQKADAIAVAYGVPRVRISHDSNRADRAIVAIDQRLHLGRLPFPDFHHPVGIPLDPMRSFELGIDDHGHPVRVHVYGHHLLLGGIPGSGKSNALRVLLGHLAASRNVALFGIDPKRVELALWRDRFTRLILGNDAAETTQLLEDLHSEIDRRTTHLSQTGQASIRPSAEFPWLVLVIDEWAEVAAGGNAKERSRTDELLRRFVSLGRAVGCTAILCTQRPTSDVIDVGTRSLLGHRFALRCTDRYQAESILGAGTYAPEELIGAGVGRVLWSDGGPVRAFQFYEVSDDSVSGLLCSGYVPTARSGLSHTDQAHPGLP